MRSSNQRAIIERLPTQLVGFLLGGFIPTCHALAIAEMTKLEKLYDMEMQAR